MAVDAEGDLVALKFQTATGDYLTVERQDDGYRTASTPVTEEVRTVLRSGEIRTSLFGAADAAGIPDAITTALADVFGGDIDFYHDLQRGDRFTVVYESRYVNGEPSGAGRLLAARVREQGRSAPRVPLPRQRGQRRLLHGHRAQRTRRVPAFADGVLARSRRASRSRASTRILQQWREHKGVDYAAPIGTPVRVTADGVVAFAGVQNGYGNVVIVRHQGTYSTLYGHLSRIAPQVRPGARVRQGDTIAFVGQTGWATGPHLHYEFRVADQARDPLAVRHADVAVDHARSAVGVPGGDRPAHRIARARAFAAERSPRVGRVTRARWRGRTAASAPRFPA